jgi:hypothetical protein
MLRSRIGGLNVCLKENSYSEYYREFGWIVTYDVMNWWRRAFASEHCFSVKNDCLVTGNLSPQRLEGDEGNQIFGR